MKTRTRTKETTTRKPIGTDGKSVEFHICQVFPTNHPSGFPAVCEEVHRELIVGREPSLDDRIVAYDPSVSGDHFRVTRSGGRLVLEDLDSKNGTYVNGKRQSQCLLYEQDVVRAGDCQFVVLHRPPRDLSSYLRHDVVAASDAMAAVVHRLRNVASRKTSVFLVGETGTGKDVMARLLHRLSQVQGEFVAENCAAIPAELVESTLFGCEEGAFTGAKKRTGRLTRAHKGTLLLDEIGELHGSVQAKLLRFLETGKLTPLGSSQPLQVDTRIVAATNRIDELGQVSSALRQDLLARLEDEYLLLPPLRERKEEIVPLLYQAIAATGVPPLRALTPDFVWEVLLYHWPRNVRQLLKAVESCLTHTDRGQRLEIAHLREHLKHSPDSDAARRFAFRGDMRNAIALRDVYEECNGNISMVARHFGCHRMTVYRLLQKFGIHKPQKEDL